MKSRYGEIARINRDNDWFCVYSFKLQSPSFILEPFIPFLYFERTKKTGRRKFKNINNIDSIFSHSEGLLFNKDLITDIRNSFEKYFNKWNPSEICFRIYEEKYEKRLKLYTFVLNTLGYKYKRKYYYDDMLLHFYEKIGE